MKMKVNLAEENSGFGPIPAGTYQAYVFDVKAKTFSTGSQGFAVQYKIADGPYKGKIIFDNIVLTEAAKFKVIQFFKAVTGAETGNVEIDTDTFPSYVGTKVEINVSLEKSEQYGEQNRIKNVKHVGGQYQKDTADLNTYLEEREPVTSVADESVPF